MANGLNWLSRALAGCCLLAGSGGLVQAEAPAPAAASQPRADIDPRIDEALRRVHKGERVHAGVASAARAANGTSASGAAIANQPLGYGWNFFYVSSCIGTNYGGTDYLYMYFSDGSVAATSDPIAIAASGAICISSPYVYLNITYIDSTGTFFLFNETFIPHT